MLSRAPTASARARERHSCFRRRALAGREGGGFGGTALFSQRNLARDPRKSAVRRRRTRLSPSLRAKFNRARPLFLRGGRGRCRRSGRHLITKTAPPPPPPPPPPAPPALSTQPQNVLKTYNCRYFRALTLSKCATVLDFSLSPLFAPPKGPTLNPFF